MSSRWGLVVAGVVVAVGVWMASVTDAWAQDSVTPLCNNQACQTSPNVWYTSPVTVTWLLSTDPAPNETIGCNELVPAPNDVLASTSCEAIWNGSDDIKRSYTLHVEVSNPSATAVPSRPPDANGWYNHPVAIAFQGSAFSGIASCTSQATYAGPDTGGTTLRGSCVDNAGKTASASLGLHYDSTPPAVTSATASRRPDHDGWYNHPVRFTFKGTDALSGISRCPPVTYAGPASAGALVVGGCVDRAGNFGARRVRIRYDATPPPLALSANAGDGNVFVGWRTGPDPAPLALIEVVRTPGLHGGGPSVVYRGHGGSYRDGRVRNGVRYRYTVTVRDQAGNASTRTLAATPGARLLSPAQGAEVSAPPLLRWTAVPGASYYNVQLYRGRKVLSTWPAKASLQLTVSWSFRGHRYQLTPGRYRWYVWPGFGPRSIALYGRLIGSGTFVVTAPAT